MMLPRNFIKELFVMVVIGIIGITIMIMSSNDVLMTIGGGVFTSSVIGTITSTMNSIRKRRADLESLTNLAIRASNRLIWLKKGSINEHSLEEINAMISELNAAESIYGRLWFIKGEDRENCYGLYHILSSINRVEPELIQYRMTATCDVSINLQIIKLKEHFEKLFCDNENLREELDELTDWAIKVCEKSFF